MTERDITRIILEEAFHYSETQSRKIIRTGKCDGIPRYLVARELRQAERAAERIIRA